MDNTFNYSLESKKVVARCNDSINNFVNLPTSKTSDYNYENKLATVIYFSSNLISFFDIKSTVNVTQDYIVH